MKKLTMLMAVPAMVLVVVVPALAQGNTGNLQNAQRFGGPVVEQGFEQETESGAIDGEFSSTNTGDNSNVCAPALQFGNTGNLQNAQGVLQYDSTADDVEFEGSSMTFEPSLETECAQDVQQAASSSSN